VLIEVVALIKAIVLTVRMYADVDVVKAVIHYPILIECPQTVVRAAVHALLTDRQLMAGCSR
jgi:hypothetical protein